MYRLSFSTKYCAGCQCGCPTRKEGSDNKEHFEFANG